MALDLLIRGATVFPGDAAPFAADVGIAAGRIAAIGRSLPGQEVGEVIEARGLMLCPGFIDLHAHSALQPFSDPILLPKIAQGFTTELINPDGLAPAPVAPQDREERRDYLQALEGPGPAVWPWSTMAEYLEVLSDTQPATTLVPSVAHSAVRSRVLGGANRPPSPAELAAMREEVRWDWRPELEPSPSG